MPLVVDICRLCPDGEDLAGELPESDFDVGLVGGARVQGSVRYELTVSLLSDELLVKGSLEMTAGGQCSRCAQSFVFTVKDEAFARAVDIDDSTEYVDLTADMREAIILAFPSHPLCRSDCKGLCAECGTNLNDGTCECRPPADDRWDALDSLTRKE